MRSDGGLPGPFNAWFYLPEPVAEAHDQLGQVQRFSTAHLPKDLKEIAILTVGVHFRCSVESWAHARVAEKAGVDAAVIAALVAGTPPPFPEQRGGDDAGAAQRVIHSFVSELLATNRVSDESYGAAFIALGKSHEAMAELAGSVGHCKHTAPRPLPPHPAHTPPPLPPQLDFWGPVCLRD